MLKRRKVPKYTVEEQACHTFALSGDATGKRNINELFQDITNPIGYRFNFGEGLTSKQLAAVRKYTMNRIASLRDETFLKADGLYLCAGFRDGQVSPEHMWLEDRVHNVTFDTMPNLPLKCIKGVGIDGKPFASGYEAQPFKGDEIYRVKVSGYTLGQIAAICPSILHKTSLKPSPKKKYHLK